MAAIVDQRQQQELRQTGKKCVVYLISAILVYLSSAQIYENIDTNTVLKHWLPAIRGHDTHTNERMYQSTC